MNNFVHGFIWELIWILIYLVGKEHRHIFHILTSPAYLSFMFQLEVPVNKESFGLNFAAALQRLFRPLSLPDRVLRPALWDFGWNCIWGSNITNHLSFQVRLTIICSLSTPSSPLASISLIWIFPSLRQEIEFEQVAMTPTGHSWNWHKEPAGKIYFLKSLMSCVVLVTTKKNAIVLSFRNSWMNGNLKKKQSNKSKF